MKFFTTILLIIATASSSFAQSICSEPKINELVNSGLHAFEQGQFMQKIKSSSVTVVGEIHFYTDLQPRLDLIKHFGAIKNGKKCVAFEFAREDEGAIKFLTQMGKFLSALKDGSFQKSSPSLTDEHISKLILAFQDLYDYYWPMVELTQKLGMNAVMVDHKDHNFRTSKTIDERNAAMAENIKNLIDSGSCDSILFFVGKAHLSKNMDSVSRVQDLIAEKKLTNTTINLQMTKESNLPLQARSWTLCPELAAMKLQDYSFFRNDALQSSYFLFPLLHNELSKWNDFEFTLLAP